jgi:hypothetical protein
MATMATLKRERKLASTVPGMEIRDATVEDAAPACEVLRRSITQLCVADHANDPAILMPWLANKTPEIVASWIARPGMRTYSAWPPE